MFDSINYPFSPPALNSFKEIIPGIYWVRIEIPIVHDHINVWAIEDNEGWALVDTGVHCPQTINFWQNLMEQAPFDRPLTKIISTHMHPDHVGLAGWFNKQFTTPLLMTETEYITCKQLVANSRQNAYTEAHAMYIKSGWTEDALASYRDTFGRFIDDLPNHYHAIDDGEQIKIGKHHWQVIIVGGHTPGHACLYCEELQLLISGDQILPLIAPNIPVLYTDIEANPMGAWLDSLDKIARIVPDSTLILPAHDDCFYGLHYRLNMLRERQAKAKDRVLNQLNDAKRVVDIFPALFKRTIDLAGNDPIPLKMATGETLAQLNFLLRQGYIERTLNNGVYWYKKSRSKERDEN